MWLMANLAPKLCRHLSYLQYTCLTYLNYFPHAKKRVQNLAPLSSSLISPLLFVNLNRRELPISIQLAFDFPSSVKSERRKGIVKDVGFAIAQRIGLEGGSVVISSRRQKNVDEVVKKLKAQGIEVLGLVCHVSNAQQRKNLIEQTVRKYGKIDVVVSNAAANPSVETILKIQEAALDKLWEINVKTSILLLKDASPHLTKGFSIVFISSISAFQPPASLTMYGVTKTALHGLTKKQVN